jgi:hypothetical protein
VCAADWLTFDSGVKTTLKYARDHSTDEALAQIRDYNAAMLHSQDLSTALKGYATKTKPTFRN